MWDNPLPLSDLDGMYKKDWLLMISNLSNPQTLHTGQHKQRHIYVHDFEHDYTLLLSNRIKLDFS